MNSKFIDKLIIVFIASSVFMGNYYLYVGHYSEQLQKDEKHKCVCSKGK